MNVIRVPISVLILVLIAIAALGWGWTGAHQTMAQATASRIVLGIAALSCAVGLILIWRPKRA
ncbi:MAG TPA: hypothetical protein VG538_02905 [Vicinamibacterales bacterium]|jgi:hypothetical protein|nr:hypothetical protein [Vicinamibacterales bacterium]